MDKSQIATPICQKVICIFLVIFKPIFKPKMLGRVPSVRKIEYRVLTDGEGESVTLVLACQWSHKTKT